MNDDPVLEEAAKWFKKLNNPSSAIYQIAHASQPSSFSSHNSLSVVDQIRKTSDKKMYELTQAVNELIKPT